MHDEDRIKERAYHLWQKEGSPEGRDKEFWERARLMVEAEGAAPISTPLGERTEEEIRVDDGLEETFPASDPLAASTVTKTVKRRASQKKA